VDGDVEGGEKPAATWSGHARRLDCRRGSQRGLQRPEVVMQVTCAGAAAVLEVGEEDPDSVKKTMHGWWRPAPREVTRR
jgi:hypothetical protein